VSEPPGGGSAVAAVVVNYNAASHLSRCLQSIAEAGVTRTVVVDNASTDGSRAVVAATGAEWVETGANLGYGAAANIGSGRADRASHPYLMVCNPDLELSKGAVDALVDRLEADAGLGAVGPKIWDGDGSLYPSARTFPDMVDAIGHGLLGQVAPNNRFTRRYRLLDWDHAEAADVDWVSGSCFLIRRQAWDQISGFDTSYFMYMEDVDLCWRLARSGWRVGYEPAAEVTHIQGVSADQHPYRMLAAHHRSMWRFACRTTSGARRAALPVVGVGLVGRLVVASLRHWLGETTSGVAPGPLP
jgi:N-acetylglucosaminyl-diphospho-decaprenol L-rhamnosyltransferase